MKTRSRTVVAWTLYELGATGFPKTSGGAGLHIYVRIKPEHGFKDVRRGALAFAREVERRAPDGFSDIEDVLSHAQREAIVKGYAQLAGFAKDQVNRSRRAPSSKAAGKADSARTSRKAR